MSGIGIDEQLPTIAIVTHYDTFGMAPVRGTEGIVPANILLYLINFVDMTNHFLAKETIKMEIVKITSRVIKFSKLQGCHVGSLLLYNTNMATYMQ